MTDDQPPKPAPAPPRAATSPPAAGASQPIADAAPVPADASQPTGDPAQPTGEDSPVPADAAPVLVGDSPISGEDSAVPADAAPVSVEDRQAPVGDLPVAVGGTPGPGGSWAGRGEAQLRPYRIEIPEAALQDLRARLGAARWPDQLPGVGWSYGVPLERLRALAEYWRTGYDWRRHERELNKFDQFTTVLDGQRVHFFHVRSPEPGALPLLLTHGWPASGTEFADLIGPLTDPRAHGGDPADAFHVVAPSIPGYGFSGPTTETGWGVTRIARAWAELMRRLGYHRYGAHGGDWGARIAPELARLDGERMIGLHLNAFVAFPDGDLAGLTDRERRIAAELENWSGERTGYAQIQGTRPQTLAYGLVDSPTGLLAWDTEWFDAYGDDVGGIDADKILTTVTITWLTGTAGSSARLYREGAANWEQHKPFCPVPTGIAVFPGDSTVRRFAEREHHVVHFSEFDRGGHFAALQVPELLTGDIRAFFRGLR